MGKSLRGLGLSALILAAFPGASWAQESAPAPATASPAAPAAPAPPAAAADDDLELPAGPASDAKPAPPASSSAPASPAPAATTAASKPGSAPNAATTISAGKESAAAGVTADAGAPKASDPKPAAASASWTEGLRLGGWLQAEYQHNQISEDQLAQGGAPINQNRFVLRRARVRLDRDWDYASGTIELDANTVNGITVGVRRAEASVLYRGSDPKQSIPLVMLTLGVTDNPFGYELLEPTRARLFMERTLASSSLFPTEADLALKISGAVSFLRYAVALTNGEPVNNNGFPRDPNAAKDLLGRIGVEVQPLANLKVWGGTSFANGTGFHPGTDAGKNSLVWRDLNEDGVQTPDEVFGVPGSVATPSKNFDRWALDLDVGATFQSPLGESKLYAEGFVANNYDRGLFVSDPVSTGVDVRQAGGYVAALQDVTKYGVAGFRASFYDPNSDLLETRQGEVLPLSQTIVTLSPLLGLVLKGRARLLFQYDFIFDNLGRDERGVPADIENNAFTARLQVEL